MKLLLLLNLFMLRGGVYRAIALAFIVGVLGLVGLGIWSLKAAQPQHQNAVHHSAARPAQLDPRASR
jgi:hypothetical protein